jgi:hypothetical protein
LEIAAPKSRDGFADIPESPSESSQIQAQAARALRRRYSVGVTPVSALKAQLNGPSDWKLASIAVSLVSCFHGWRQAKLVVDLDVGNVCCWKTSQSRAAERFCASPTAANRVYSVTQRIASDPRPIEGGAARREADEPPGITTVLGGRQGLKKMVKTGVQDRREGLIKGYWWVEAKFLRFPRGRRRVGRKVKAVNRLPRGRPNNCSGLRICDRDSETSRAVG